MKRILLPAAFVLIGGGIGFSLALLFFTGSGSESGEGSGEPEILYWVAPMDPNYRRDKPGKSPMGMDLVPVYAGSETTEEDVVLIEPHVVQNLGVRTEPVVETPLDRRIRTVGYVEYDENALHHIHTRVDGWIEKLSVKAEGDPIVANQVLFELYSPALVNAQEEYLMAKAGGQDDMIEASTERLKALGLVEDQIDELASRGAASQYVPVRAKSDGVVDMLGISEGVAVTPDTHVMSIAELDKVWVVAEVLERQAGYVKVGQRVQFELDSAPGKIFNGQVDYIYPELDPDTRSLKVRITFEPNEVVVRPNMFAHVTILVEGTESVLHVPHSSVIRGGLTDRVVLDIGDGKFRSAPVVLGMEADGRVQIVEGLKAGDRVATSGQFMIDSESNIETALERFEEERAQRQAPKRATVEAVVRGKLPEKSQIRVKHGKVPEFNWRMTMTMNLPVADVEMLDDVEIDEEVDLVIEKRDSGYLIVDIQSKEAPTPVTVKGVVRSTDNDEAKLKVKHDPVPEFGWGSMTMDLEVADVDLLDGLSSDQNIEMDIEKRGPGVFVIVDIRPATEEE